MEATEKTPFFRKPVIWLFLIAAISLLFLQQCRRKKYPIVEIKSPIQAPMGVAFIEVGGASIRNVPKVKVTFIDSSGFVMSSNGIPLKSIQVSGVISIGLSPKARVSIENPYLFYIRAEADGYMTNIAPVVVTANVPGYVPIFMAKLNNLPPGNGLVSSVNNISGISDGTVQRDERIEAKSEASGPNISISISKGTQLYYQNKKPYDKEKLSYRLLSGSPLDSVANRVFPGGFEVNNAVDQREKRIASPANPSFFTSAGWFSLEMSDDEGQIVDGFSQPVVIEMSIPEKVLGTNSTPVKIGDSIPLWSMNRETGQWKAEGLAIALADGNGGMKTVFNITHLSSWNLDFTSGTCPSGNPLGSISVNYTNSEFSGQYYSEFIREDNGAVLKKGQVDLSPGTPMKVLRVPDLGLTTAKIYVHNGQDVGYPLRGRSTPLTCSSPNNSLGIPGSPAFPCVQFCFTNNPGELCLCGPSLWYQEGCGTSGYLFHAGNLQNGLANVPSTGSSTECLELRFTSTDPIPKEIIMKFRIVLSGSGQTDVSGDAIIDGTTIQDAFTFDYSQIPVSNFCNKKIKVTINPGAITGIPSCPGPVACTCI